MGRGAQLQVEPGGGRQLLYGPRREPMPVPDPEPYERPAIPREIRRLLGKTLAEPEYYKSGIGRQKIKTGVREFDNQTTSLSGANMIGGTVITRPIRPARCPLPSGERARRGAMRDWDLEHFGTELPKEVLAAVREQCEQDHCLLSWVFHHTRAREEISHGFIVCDADHRFLRWFPSAEPRSRQVLETCLPYLAIRP